MNGDYYFTSSNKSLLYNRLETQETSDNSFGLKRKYINDLLPAKCGKSEYVHLEEYLFTRPVDTLMALYLSLRNVFTDNCSNTERGGIINCLLKVDQNQWIILLKQVCFIMPIGTRGHDVMWATEVLSSVVNSSFREQLVKVANRFFNYDTRTIERGYILKSLAELDSKTLSTMYDANEQTIAQFVEEHVPRSIKEGAKLAFLYDQIQEKGWEI